MKKGVISILFLFLIGCASGFERDMSDYRFVVSGKTAVESERDELRKVVEDAWPLINNLIFCVNANPVKDIFINYEKRYVKYFNENMLNLFHDQEKVKKMNQRRRAKIGKYVSCEFGQIQKTFKYFTFFYKVKCTKIKGIGIIRMVVKRNDEGKLEITFLSFLPYE